MLGAQAVIFVVLPMVSDLHARGRRAELQALVVRTVQGCAAMSIPVVALLLVGGRTVLHAYGSAFLDAYPILAVLVTGPGVNCPAATASRSCRSSSQPCRATSSSRSSASKRYPLP